MKNKLRQLPPSLRRHLRPLWRKASVILRSKYFILAVSLSSTAIVLLAAISFFKPQTLVFGFSSPNCFFNPVLLPGTVPTDRHPDYALTLENTVTVGAISLFSAKTCVAATTPPEAGTSASLSLAPFGNTLLKKSITVTPAPLPVSTPLTDFSQPVSSKGRIAFQLDQEDSVFTYRLSANDRQADCQPAAAVLTCDLANLELAQSTAYDLALLRSFKHNITGEIYKTSITTIDPVVITGSSITDGQTVYDNPGTLTLTLNKAAVKHGGIKLVQNGTDTDIPVTAATDGLQLSIHFSPLPREASFTLTIETLESADGSYLPAVYTLNFQTSGGPKVKAASIGATKVSLTGNINLTFDTGLASDQNFASYVKISAGGADIPAAISAKGSSLTINPAASLPRCTPFTITVSDGITSEYGISGGSDWSYSARTICQSVFSIGTSVQGRAITAYKFGTGASKIIFVGGTHGNEKSSVYTLNGLVDYLESNALSIPAHRSVIVIPNLNPDSFASSGRLNANGVDLNRNFPSNNWQTGVYIPGNIYLPEGGGSAPLSEPEADALASYISNQGPSLVLTYHAVARVVISNDAGDSYSLAQTYGSKSGYSAIRNSDSHDTFEYDSTGEFEDWLADKRSIAALLIELGTMSSNEFNTHKNAMWAMVQLP